MKKYLRNILMRISPIRKYAAQQFVRYFTGSKTTRLVNDWISELESINEALKYEFTQLLARSRELAANNDYVKGFLKRCVTNIVGPDGFTLQSRALKNNDPDDEVNNEIESKWYEWCNRKYASLDQKMSFVEIQKLAVKMWKRDGNVLVRKIINTDDNKFGFSLQLLDIDMLALKYNDELSNGNVVKMGVEYDKSNKRVAYWLYLDKPSNNLLMHYYYNIANGAVRIPSDEILHFYTYEFPDQVLGVPAVTQSLITLHNLRGYDEAAIINARAGAYKMGFIQSQPNAGIVRQFEGQEVDENGNIISEFSPGIIEQLPQGLEFKGWDPSYPNNEYPGFIKAVLRRIATGLGVAYANWVGDLEAVNFSSMRSGLLDERDNWKDDQSSFVEGFLIPIYEEWLKYSIISGQINVSFFDYDRINKPEFIGRRWDWVDPRADIEAKVMAVKNNLITLTDVMAEMGVDFEDYVRRRRKELEKLKEIKLLEQELFSEKPTVKVNNNGNGKASSKLIEELQ